MAFHTSTRVTPETSGIDGRRRALVVRAEAAVLPAATARSLGLVVTELVTNAFRHAFAADEAGTVWATGWGCGSWP